MSPPRPRLERLTRPMSAPHTIRYSYPPTSSEPTPYPSYQLVDLSLPPYGTLPSGQLATYPYLHWWTYPLIPVVPHPTPIWIWYPSGQICDYRLMGRSPTCGIPDCCWLDLSPRSAKCRHYRKYFIDATTATAEQYYHNNNRKT